MKKIIFALCLLFSLAAAAQTTPPGYTFINQRYRWFGGLFDRLTLPTQGTRPLGVTPYVWPGSGEIRVDTVGQKVYVRFGLTWVQLADSASAAGASTWQQVLTQGSRLTVDNTASASNHVFTWDSLASMAFKGSNTFSSPTTLSLDDLIYLYRQPSDNQGRLEVASGSVLQLRGGVNTAGVVIIPNPYNLAGGNVSFNNTDANYSDIKIRSGGNTDLGQVYIYDRQFGIKALGDSTDLRLKSSQPASVVIDSSRLAEAYGANVTAANDLMLGYAGNTFTVTGNTEIHAIATHAWQSGSLIRLNFTGTPVIKDNTAGSAGTAKIQLSGNTDYTVSAGDVIQLLYDGTDFKEIGRSYAAVAPGTVPGIDDVLAVGQQLTDDRTIDANGHDYRVQAAGAASISSIVNFIGSAIFEASGTAGNIVASRGGHNSQLQIYSDSIIVRPDAGIIKIDTLQTTSDTTNYKPTAWNEATGSFRKMNYWPGGTGGGGGTGTVTSVATNTGSGITGGTITTSGTLAIDTSIIATKAYANSIAGGGGGTIGGSIATNQIAVGSGTNTIAGASTFTWNGQTLMLGDFTPTGTTTPVTMNSGATYGSDPAGSASNLKWRLYDDNAGSTYGFGISNGKLEYQSGASASHVFYNAGTEAFRIGATGTISVGSSQQFQVNSSGKIIQYGNTPPTNGKLLIGHTANGTFELGNIASSDASITVTNNAGGIDVALNATQSTYTPTPTNTTGIAASTAYVTNYRRIGDVVEVWGEISIDATTALTVCELGLSLPVATSIANTYNLAGTASFEDNTAVLIKGDVTNNRATFRFTPQTATNNKYSFHFTYKYIAP